MIMRHGGVYNRVYASPINFAIGCVIAPNPLLDLIAIIVFAATTPTQERMRPPGRFMLTTDPRFGFALAHGLLCRLPLTCS